MFDALPVMCTAITCGTIPPVFKFDSITATHVNDTMLDLSASNTAIGRCPESGADLRRLFANGATTESIKCTAKGNAGVFSHQPGDCKGSLPKYRTSE